MVLDDHGQSLKRPSRGTLNGPGERGVLTPVGLAVAMALLGCSTSDAGGPTPGPEATHLAFLVQPGDGGAGATITPAPEVGALDSSDDVVTGFTGSVTVSLGTNPGGGILTGATTVQAAAGIATFTNLTLDKAGTGYTLTAAASGLGGATSGAFAVAPSPVVTHLVFVQQPSNTQVNAHITPAVTVAARDASNNLVQTYHDSVSVALSANVAGGVLAGTVRAAAVGGVATFPDLAVDKAGTGYTLTAAATQVTGATSSPFDVTAPQPSPVDTIFYDGFESGTKSAWNDDYEPTHHTVVTDGTNAHAGTRYLRIDYPAGGDGGALSHFFLPGYDTVTASYWVKFPNNWQGGTKLLLLRGSRTDNIYSSFGVAGKCPTGTDWFVSNVVTRPDSTLPLRFYTYYIGMPTEPDGVTCYGRYGDTATPPAVYYAPLGVTKGQWHRVELEIVVNTPGSANGQQRMWLDGVLKGEWTGLNFRASSILKLDAVTLESSMNETQGGSPQNQSLSVDDVLVVVGRRPSP